MSYPKTIADPSSNNHATRFIIQILLIAVLLTLALILVAGCTRAKSGPPEPTATESGAQATTQLPPAGTPATPFGQEVIAGTSTAWAIETATAAAQSAPDTPQVTETPTPTPETGAAADTDTPTPTPTLAATPQPTVVIEAEWPSRMETEKSDTIRVSLIRTAGRVSAPAIEVEGHTAFAATAEPVDGTPEAPIEEAFGPQYEGFACANLVGESFDKELLQPECQSLNQSRMTWDWSIDTNKPGEQAIIASVMAQWRFVGDDEQLIERQIWRARLEILVLDYRVKTSQVTTFSAASLMASSLFFMLWLYQKLRERRRQREYDRFLRQALGAGFDLEALRRTLTEHFDIEELRTLCFDLGVDFGSLGGEGKIGKVRELVVFMARRGRLEELIWALRRARPNLTEDFRSRE